MMDLVPAAITRLHEYRQRLGENETIDEVGGFSSGDIDVILAWADARVVTPGSEAEARPSYPLRALGRVAVVFAIVLVMILIWRSIGT